MELVKEYAGDAPQDVEDEHEGDGALGELEAEGEPPELDPGEISILSRSA